MPFWGSSDRWLQWLFAARCRYDPVIPDYVANHIHLLVFDQEGRDVIAGSIQTAVESGEHLLKCLVTIDLNMARAGVAEHPSKWPFGGYNEIRQPHRKCRLIAHERLRELFAFSTYEELTVAHKL